MTCPEDLGGYVIASVGNFAAEESTVLNEVSGMAILFPTEY
jgi:hypothetical protein